MTATTRPAGAHEEMLPHGDGPADAVRSETGTRQAAKETRGRERFMSVAVVYILISVLVGAIGQLLLKSGMNNMGEVTLSVGGVPHLLARLALNPYVVGGLFLYACGTIFWLSGISRVDLSFAYPFASLSYVVMLVAAWQLFDEQISLLRLLGTGVIALGVLIISRS